jgi:hypothetical protein
MFNFFIRKDTITKRVWEWTFQVEVYFETQSILKPRPNLISLKCKVESNMVFYLLDSRIAYSFIKPSMAKWLKWIVTKVVKPIKV